jgi:uncharacterized protein YggE
MALRQTFKKAFEGEKSSVYGLFVVAGISVALALVLFLLASTVAAVKSYAHIGKSPVYPSSLPVTGKGEILIMPDIASFNFSIIESGANVGEAQKKATAKNNDIIEYLKEKGLEPRDIKTTGYNAYPKYEYVAASGEQNLIGYEVNQTVTVKVRDADMAGDLLSEVGNRGVSNVSGLTFTVDDEDTLKRQARDQAIEDAKEQAVKLSEQLGVRLGKIIGYYELENPGYPYPMHEDASMMKSSVAPQALPPQIERGEQTIRAQVSVTFEIE